MSARLQARRADEPRLQERASSARRLAPDLPRRGSDAAGGGGCGGRGGPRAGSRRLEISPPAEPMSRGAASCCEKAKRPVMIVGHGARFHMEQVTGSAEQLGAPVITTFKAKGQIADDHPLAAGVLGRSGTPVASWVMNEADTAARARRVVLQPHRHLPGPSDHPGRLRPDAAGQVPPGRGPGLGRDRRRRRSACAPSSRDELADRGPGGAARRPLGDLAGGEGEPRGRRPRRTASTRPRSSRRWSDRSPKMR